MSEDPPVQVPGVDVSRPMAKATQRLIEAKQKWSERTAAERAALKQQMAEREERARAKQKLATAKWKCRRALAKSNFKKAEQIALEHGFTVEEARVGGVDKGVGLPSVPPPPEPVPEPVATPAIDYINGWPRTAQVEIWGFCRNPKLVVIKLPDGREACVYAEARHWRRGEQLLVELEEASADPRYRWVPGSIT